VIVVVCPGQGSQTPGFLSPWLELDGAREKLAHLSDHAGIDLIRHGTQSDADTIRDTKIAQPLIVAASILSWSALSARVRAADAHDPQGVAGHSVGELAALAAARVIDDETAMRLVGVRGRAMAEAAALETTGMSAVLGGDETDVLTRLRDLDLTPANFNGGGQIVAAGAIDALAALAAEPPRATRVIPLQVAGAFHTRFMEPAVETLRIAADEVAPHDPDLILWTNHDGTTVTSGARALDLLVGQVASPVRWDLCMSSFADHGVTGIIELAPAGALVGLAKRALRGVPSVAVKTPDDLDTAVAMLTGESS
jgi:[acyl-carrier-protein] S-malonyltransferase